MHTTHSLCHAIPALLLLCLGWTAFPTRLQGQKPTSAWKLVMEDQFNGSVPDTALWSAPPRGQSMWSRWIADSPDLVFTRRGKLVCRAVPATAADNDSVPMRTGALWTRNKFNFRYGRIELRMRTNLLPGNFPAAWMGRFYTPTYIPPYGEIDIVEMVDKENLARHAYHTAYTENTPKHGQKNASTTKVDVTRWHVYAVEWSPEALVWFVDGRETWRYDKPKDATRLKRQEWTFDVPFYLLINQSIMHGKHGKEALLDHTYETEFDWVRIYQKQP